MDSGKRKQKPDKAAEEAPDFVVLNSHSIDDDDKSLPLPVAKAKPTKNKKTTKSTRPSNAHLCQHIILCYLCLHVWETT